MASLFALNQQSSTRLDPRASPLRNNIRYQIPKSLLFSHSALSLRLSPTNNDSSQKRKLETLLKQTNLLDLSSAEKSKSFRVSRIQRDYAQEEQKSELLKLHEKRIARALKKSKDLLSQTIEERKEANL